ncbi:hypothetical protein BC937DRAFT_90361 [Endogone sp. FLAS-F59071]|nr:hypothetical protein BC937DRAFT_90361 [Endogone sp. FLAS-F59071]|eukprot:RUS22107.1 hypothetical protein BC937DRAFT_90361 [Endogone sp. FLAS-F59071]
MLQLFAKTRRSPRLVRLPTTRACRRNSNSSTRRSIDLPEKPQRKIGTSYEPVILAQFISQLASAQCAVPSTQAFELVEKGWYEWWESQGYFAATSADYDQAQQRQQFTMLTPPPNITGSLHVGHALTFSIEDAIARWRRMSGYQVSWIPGTDHAGIGTQTVVERQLMKDKQLTRHDLGRTAFIDEIWKWRTHYGDRIIQQMRRLGISADWKRLFFTLDEPRSEAVRSAFVRLFDDGLIYRDTRLVNWCCTLETVISDIEIEYQEIQGQTFIELPGRSKSVEFGVLHKFAYPVADPAPDGIAELVVATTRIETMLGDCAVAIHPKDPRYMSLHGKALIHPILGKRIPVVCDAELVNMEFGTGAVKVTPAHDQNDYALARRHNLPVISIFNKDGTLNASCGVEEFVRQDRFSIRDLLVDRLTATGHYRGKVTDHAMRVARCSRSGDFMEPLVQPQWYIRCKGLAARAIEDVRKGDVRIRPEYHTDEWYRWLENVQDWCISRQLWWGHRVPAYQLHIDTNILPALVLEQFDKSGLWFAACNWSDAQDRVHAFLKQHELPANTPFTLTQDADVLDTWFSSSLLPLSALGWTGSKAVPDTYPTNILETGLDILFFWVARMAMLCTYFANEPPFSDIFLHAMIRDSQGRKMSKSLGNVIDPLHVIDGVNLETLRDGLRASNLGKAEIERSLESMEKEFPEGIPACGTDSLRFALVDYSQQTRQINLDVGSVIVTKHFGNKLWQVMRFGLSQFEAANHKLQANPSASLPTDLASISLVNRYVLSRLAAAVEQCQNGMGQYRLHEATDAVRRFVVEELCDVYVEFSKPVLQGRDEKEEKQCYRLPSFRLLQQTTLNIIGACLDVSLKLAHPFMPFITEELWQNLQAFTSNKSAAPSLMVASYPSKSDFSQWKDETVERDFKTILSIIHASRSLRQINCVSVTRELPFFVWSDDPVVLEPYGPLRRYAGEIARLARASELKVVDATTHHDVLNASAVKVITPRLRVYTPMSAVLAAQATAVPVAERVARLRKKLERTERELEEARARMSREDYAKKVPEMARNKDSKRIAMLEHQREDFERNIELLRGGYGDIEMNDS